MAAARVSEHVLRRRVLFHEVDLAGIVHFSNYLRYMEEAEHALWRAAGLSIAPAGAEVGFPRVNATCDYRRPLRFEDEFDVRIRVAAIGRSSIRYACVLTCDGEEVAAGSVTSVCVGRGPDGAYASVPIPERIAARFAVGEA